MDRVNEEELVDPFAVKSMHSDPECQRSYEYLHQVRRNSLRRDKKKWREVVKRIGRRFYFRFFLIRSRLRPNWIIYELNCFWYLIKSNVVNDSIFPLS